MFYKGLYLTKLKNALNTVLPGYSAHLKLAPKERIEGIKHRERAANAKSSAVLIILFPENNELKVLFIQRSIYDGAHSGQISFPGGQEEKSDKNLLTTALRETKEEVGLEIEENNILGKLSELYIPPSNFIVQPYVAFTEELGTLSIDPNEVQEVYKISLNALLEENSIQNKSVLLLNKLSISAPCFFIDKLIIWGATAMILNELLEVIRSNGLAVDS